MCEEPWAESVFWMFTILVDVAQFAHRARAFHPLLIDGPVQQTCGQPWHR